MAKDTKKGLGRGLSELFGDDILDNENEGELIYAPIAKVEPRAEQREIASTTMLCRSLQTPSRSTA